MIAALQRERPEYIMHAEEGYLYEEWREQVTHPHPNPHPGY